MQRGHPPFIVYVRIALIAFVIGYAVGIQQ